MKPDLTDLWENPVLGNIRNTFDPFEGGKSYDNFNSRKGLLWLSGAYGATLGVRHGARHLTPITQKMAKPLQQASTRIEGYYKPGVTSKEKVTLLVDHWKKGGTPALTEYLEKYKNTPDPFGQTFPKGATDANLEKLRQGISKRGALSNLSSVLSNSTAHLNSSAV